MNVAADSFGTRTVAALAAIACVALLSKPTCAWAQETAPAQDAGVETQANAPTDPHSAAVPSSEELDAARAVVGEIKILNANVFATETPEEDKWLFRLANTLHIQTRPEVIRQQLLLQTGAPYSDRLARESERILRSNRYLYDAQIVPVAYHDGVVDIEVRTRDVWTLKPGINFGRSGGKNSSGFEIQESNLLGFGKEITFARRSNVDRTATEFRYFDPRIAGSWTSFIGSYSSNSDGKSKFVGINRPFYSLDTRWSAQTSAWQWDRTEQRYDLGNVVDEFRHSHSYYELSGGWSDGWRRSWVQRITGGYSYRKDEFTPTLTPFSASVLPADRLLAYPYVRYTLLQDDFEERRNQNQIERTEDHYAGTFVQATLGLASPAFGANTRAWIWGLAAGATFESDEKKHTLVLSGGINGRTAGDTQQNVLATGGATYYWRVAPRQLFYAALRGAAGEHFDADKQLTLGGDNGLRGYPLRYQDGTSQALLTLEHRIFTKYYIFRLFHLGGAVFFDVGRSWGSGVAREANPNPLPGVRPDQGTLKDVGLGLRFGSSRSAFGNVIHVDLAFPLDGDPSIQRVQFIVETKQSF